MPPPPDEFSQYVRKPVATAAPKDEFAQFARPAAPTPQPMPAGTFQTMRGGPLQQVSQIGAQPLTYATPGAAVSGAQARAALPEFQQQLAESKKSAAGMAPTVGATIGSGFGAAGMGAGEAVGELAKGRMEGKPADIPGAVMHGMETAAFGKAGELAISTALGAIPTGKYILNKIVGAKDAKQVGNAMEAFMEAKPAGMTRQMLMRDLDAAHKAASDIYSHAVHGSTASVDMTNLMNPIQAEALARDAKVPGVDERVAKLIEAAKMKAGIQSNIATMEQLASFKNVVRKVAYRATDDPIALATNDVMKMADHAAGTHIRATLPEAGPALDSMTKMHAARSALANYKPGKAASIAVSAALHPRAAQFIAPPAAAAAAIGGRKLLRTGEAAIAALP